jgi:hypothetical protein
VTKTATIKRSRRTWRSNAASGDRADIQYKVFAACAFGFALVITIAYGCSAAAPGHALRAALAAALSGLAAFACGGFVGFLFALPKTLAAEAANGNATASRLKDRSWQANTSLEQISDWLTKILLGIGLTQLTQLPEQIQSTGEYVADAIGPDAAAMVGSTIVVVFAIAGFVIANLVTRFDLGKAIDREDGVLENLKNLVASDPDDRRAVEALVVTSLYLPPPDGFEAAIRAGEDFLARTKDLPPAEVAQFNAYLAAAYGQKYGFERATTNSSEQLRLLRARLLEHVRIAVASNPELKGYFQSLANPSPGSLEDDLEDFRTDPDFVTLIT